MPAKQKSARASNKSHSLVVSAEIATDQIRTEMWEGREYTVAPVVALVEGVLEPANTGAPELALASEFGKSVGQWNGRPVTMDHPQVNGNYVSANSPSTLADWQIGTIFNATLEGNKLKVEAWLDNGRIAEMGGEAASTLDRINSGDLVEVSTGLQAVSELSPGVFNGEAYSGIWREITSDHLALLNSNSQGACSVADGCGIPRFNHSKLVQSNQTNTNANANAGDCGCGGHDGGECSCDKETTVNTTEQRPVQDTPQLLELKSGLPALVANAYPDDMLDTAARGLLRAALRTRVREEGDALWAIWGMTQNNVIYETWTSLELFSLNFDISDNNVVTFTGDPQEVILIEQIQTLSGIIANTATANKEDDMSKDKANAGTEAEAAEAKEDPIVYTAADGTEIRASHGEAVLAFAKKADVDAAEARTKVLAERAEELKSLGGTDEDRIALVTALESVEDETQRKRILESLRGSSFRATVTLGSVGTSDTRVNGSAGDLSGEEAREIVNARAQELVANGKADDIRAARMLVYKQSPDLERAMHQIPSKE